MTKFAGRRGSWVDFQETMLEMAARIAREQREADELAEAIEHDRYWDSVVEY